MRAGSFLQSPRLTTQLTMTSDVDGDPKEFALVIDLPLGPPCTGTTTRTSPVIVGVRADVKHYPPGPLGVHDRRVPSSLP